MKALLDQPSAHLSVIIRPSTPGGAKSKRDEDVACSLKPGENIDTLIHLHTPRGLLLGSEAIDQATVGIEAAAINNVEKQPCSLCVIGMQGFTLR